MILKQASGRNAIRTLSALTLLIAGLSMSTSTQADDDLMPLFSPPITATEPAGTNPAASKPAEENQSEENPPPLPAATPVAPPAKPSTKATSDVTAIDLQTQKDQKFQELKRQVEILNQLMPTPEAGQSGDEFSQPVPDPEYQSTEESSESPSMEGELKVSESPSLISPEDASESDSLSEAANVVEGTIDRFALATSLFGTGEVETCLDVLKHTDLSQLSREDQIWGEYLQACCHRKAGRTELAQQSYRRILGQKDAGWIGDLARWWLDDLEEKTRLKADVQRLSETLAAWEAEIESLAQQPDRTTADR